MIVEFIEKHRVAKIFEKRFKTNQYRRKSKTRNRLIDHVK